MADYETLHVCRLHMRDGAIHNKLYLLKVKEHFNNVYNFGGDPVTQLNLKNVFVYEIGLIAIREV